MAALRVPHADPAIPIAAGPAMPTKSRTTDQRRNSSTRCSDEVFMRVSQCPSCLSRELRGLLVSARMIPPRRRADKTSREGFKLASTHFCEYSLRRVIGSRVALPQGADECIGGPDVLARAPRSRASGRGAPAPSGMSRRSRADTGLGATAVAAQPRGWRSRSPPNSPSLDGSSRRSATRRRQELALHTSRSPGRRRPSSAPSL
jgi:hypothetical protein